MNNMNLDVKAINNIIKKIIEEISSSRNEILNIVDSIRNDNESIKSQLLSIKNDIGKVIDEVDKLEKEYKLSRNKLAKVSSNFDKYTENDIKDAYEKASDVKIKYNAMKNEEKSLREKRNTLEIALRKTLSNIEDGERIINQIGIAMSYLEGDILTALEGTDNSSEMFIGIKILEAQENERKRIARDIHDGPAQHMANVVMKVDICTMMLQRNFEEGINELTDLKESVKSALKEVRNIIFDLRPMSLDDLGLNETIKQTVNAISKEADINTTIKLKPINTEIEAIIQVAVYRIVQEIFNNIRKHSKAKNAEVKLDFGAKYLIIIISDDGIGFNVEEILNKVKTTGTSYGLIGILDRVKQLQGDMEIKSSENKGTTYTVKLPINREVMKDEKQGN